MRLAEGGAAPAGSCPCATWSGAVSEIVDYPSEEFARTLAVHVLGAFHILKHGAPHVPDGGSIIITSSVVGLIGFEGLSGYIE